MSDMRLAFRQLKRVPAFTTTVVLTLALGLGVNASVFFLVSDFFLRPLPVKEPRELVHVFQRIPRLDFPDDLSYPDYLDFRRAIDGYGDRPAAGVAAVFSGILAFQQLPVALGRAESGAERAWVAAVSDNFFSVLGVGAAQGRLFTGDEGVTPNADPVIVLTDACWRARFGADRRAVDQQVVVNGVAFTVIGVTPPGFHGAQWSDAVSGFVPATMLPTLQPGNRGVLSARGQTAFRVMARLRTGTSIAEAGAAADAVLAELIARYPDVHAPAARVQLLPERMSRPVPKASRFTALVVAILAAGALLVLAVTIANVTNLLFARAVDRERELAIRGSLGASRWRLVRPLLAESLLMAAAAGGIGLLLAAWAKTWLDANLAVLGDVPPTATYGADWRVFAFTAGTSLGAGVLAAIVPALRAARRDVLPALKSSAATARASRNSMRSVLVVGQVTLACVVLVAAGLGVRSMQALASVDPGFRSDHLLLASYDLSLQRYVLRNGLPRARQFHDEVLERVARLPGVASVSLAERVPLDVDPSMAGSVVGEGQSVSRDSAIQLTPVHAVTHTFHETMAMPLVAGRAFHANDDANAPRVAIISEALARRLWPDEHAVGRRIVINRDRPIEVVGVVRDGRFIALADPKWPAVFLPLAQNFRGRVTLVVRTEGEPLALAPSVERVVRSLEPDLPVFNVRTMEQQVSRSPMGLMPLRFGTIVVGAQGLLALVLALTGIYGLVAFTVARRTREIGVRMALGATSINVTRLVAGQSMRLAIVGLVAGLPLALLGVRPLRSVLYGVAPDDPVVAAGVAVLVLAIALAACWRPAHRATRINPLDALRAE